MKKSNLSPLFQKIDMGVRLAIKEAIENHRKLDQSISIYQDGKVVTLKGKEIDSLLNDNC